MTASQWSRSASLSLYLPPVKTSKTRQASWVFKPTVLHCWQLAAHTHYTQQPVSLWSIPGIKLIHWNLLWPLLPNLLDTSQALEKSDALFISAARELNLLSWSLHFLDKYKNNIRLFLLWKWEMGDFVLTERCSQRICKGEVKYSYFYFKLFHVFKLLKPSGLYCTFVLTR